MIPSRFLPFAALLLAAPATAQTTHVVQLFAESFLPDDLTIQVGDTVRFEWATGFHNVVSGEDPGQLGNPNGIFNSGFPVPPPSTFEVVFDQAFLNANPVAGNVYEYYCVVHLPQMVGRVTVDTNPGSVSSFGYVNNPPLSLTAVGTAATGTTIGFDLRNPDDSTAGPGVGIIFFASAPDANFPAGTTVPGFGMSPSLLGDIVVSLTPPDPFLVLGPVAWAEGGTVNASIPLPNDPALVGASAFVQGALIDTTVTNGIGLSNGLTLTFG